MDFKKYGITSPQDLMNYFVANMKYGFVSRKNVFTDSEPDFQAKMDKFYKLRLGEDFFKHKYGVCWDFCVFERSFFESIGIENKCFFIESFINRKDGGPTHTFALYKSKNKWFWFEYAWQYYRGIHKYDSIEAALKDILEKFTAFFDRKLLNARVYQMPDFKKRVNTFEFVEQCLKSKRVL